MQKKIFKKTKTKPNGFAARLTHKWIIFDGGMMYRYLYTFAGATYKPIRKTCIKNDFVRKRTKKESTGEKESSSRVNLRR